MTIYVLSVKILFISRVEVLFVMSYIGFHKLMCATNVYTFYVTSTLEAFVNFVLELLLK